MIDTDRARTTATALAALPTAQKLIVDLCDQLDDARRVIDRARAQSGTALGLADDPEGPPLLGEAIKQLVADRDAARAELGRVIAARAEAIEKIPALRAKVAAGVALRPEIGAVDDEDAMALLIMAAADVHGLWEREQQRTAELREALGVSRLASEGWERRAADAGLMVGQLRAAMERALDDAKPTDAEIASIDLEALERRAGGWATPGQIVLRAALAATDPAGAGR